MSRHSTRIPLILAAFHAMLFAITVTYIYRSSQEQASLVWVYWAIPDFPITLLYLCASRYSSWVHHLMPRQEIIQHILYLPHVIHGLLGTIWWYIMPRTVARLWHSLTPRRSTRATPRPTT